MTIKVILASRFPLPVFPIATYFTTVGREETNTKRDITIGG
jgi:hypothetical protein